MTNAIPEGGPRIVINPAVFEDKRDALCVAFNEALRIVMEETDFEPMSEPTDKQREFFTDTAYADNELQLRRTILARIATLDTSVKDPTDEQIEETMEFLEMVMEIGAPQNEWEQSAIQRLHDLLGKMLETPAEERVGKEEPTGADVVEETEDNGGTVQGDVDGGETEEDEPRVLSTVVPARQERTRPIGQTKFDRERAANPGQGYNPGGYFREDAGQTKFDRERAANPGQGYNPGGYFREDAGQTKFDSWRAANPGQAYNPMGHFGETHGETKFDRWRRLHPGEPYDPMRA